MKAISLDQNVHKVFEIEISNLDEYYPVYFYRYQPPLLEDPEPPPAALFIYKKQRSCVFEIGYRRSV